MQAGFLVGVLVLCEAALDPDSAGQAQLSMVFEVV